MLGNFSASVLKVDIDGAAFTECNAFLGSKTGFQLYAQLALADPERGAFFWPPEGNDGSTTAAEVPSAGSVALEYPTYGPKPEAKEEGDGDEAEATAETEETPVGPYGDPERAKQFDLSKDSMNTLLNCPLNVRVFASVCSLFLFMFESTGGDKEAGETHVVKKYAPRHFQRQLMKMKTGTKARSMKRRRSPTMC